MMNYRLWPIPKSHAETQISGPRNVLFTKDALPENEAQKPVGSTAGKGQSISCKDSAELSKRDNFFDPNVVKPTIKEPSDAHIGSIGL